MHNKQVTSNSAKLEAVPKMPSKHVTYTQSQIEVIASAVACQAYMKMNENWRYGKLGEISKAENEQVWKAASLYCGSEHDGATLLYLGDPMKFADELEKLVQSKSIMDCTVAVGAAMALVVKRLLGERFTDYCQDLYWKLASSGQHFFFFHLISRLFTIKDDAPKKGSQVYFYNIPEYETLIGGPARGIFLIHTTPLSYDSKFLGFAKEFKNGPGSLRIIARHFYDAFYSDEYVFNNQPSKELLKLRKQFEGNVEKFGGEVIDRNAKARTDIRSFNAILINNFLEHGKYPCPHEHI